MFRVRQDHTASRLNGQFSLHADIRTPPQPCAEIISVTSDNDDRNLIGIAIGFTGALIQMIPKISH